MNWDVVHLNRDQLEIVYRILCMSFPRNEWVCRRFIAISPNHFYELHKEPTDLASENPDGKKMPPGQVVRLPSWRFSRLTFDGLSNVTIVLGCRAASALVSPLEPLCFPFSMLNKTSPILYARFRRNLAAPAELSTDARSRASAQ